MSPLEILKKALPWRIYYWIQKWVEKELRAINPLFYKFLKFGRTNINTSEYWNTVWRNDTIDRNYDELFKIIFDHIPSNSKVLDVGCGVGRLTKKIINECSSEVVGLDFSQWACAQLSKEGVKTIVSSLPTIPCENNSFDVAVATEVLEHLDNPELTIRQMFRVVKPGGIVMCSVPNDALHPHTELEHQQSFDELKIQKMLMPYSSKIEIYIGKLLKTDDLEFLFAKAIVQ